MPLVSMRQLLDHAAERGHGIPSFPPTDDDFLDDLFKEAVNKDRPLQHRQRGRTSVRSVNSRRTRRSGGSGKKSSGSDDGGGEPPAVIAIAIPARFHVKLTVEVSGPQAVPQVVQVAQPTGAVAQAPSSVAPAPSKPPGQPIVTLKPTLWGMSIDLNTLWRKVVEYVRSRNRVK